MSAGRIDSAIDSSRKLMTLSDVSLKYLYALFLFAADIYDEVSRSLQPLGLDTECLGGGRIAHDPNGKPQIKVYGYSQVRKSISVCLRMLLIN